jgi:hypothetical protein
MTYIEVGPRGRFATLTAAVAWARAKGRRVLAQGSDYIIVED